MSHRISCFLSSCRRCRKFSLLPNFLLWCQGPSWTVLVLHRGRIFSEGPNVAPKCPVEHNVASPWHARNSQSFGHVGCWRHHISAFLKKMKNGGFSVLMNIVRFCTNRSTSHSTLEHTLHATFFSHFGARTLFSVSSPNVASRSSARHVCHAAHTYLSRSARTCTRRCQRPNTSDMLCIDISLTLHIHKVITVNTTNCTIRSGKTSLVVLSSTPK